MAVFVIFMIYLLVSVACPWNLCKYGYRT